MNIRDEESRSKHVLVRVRNLALGYDQTPLFEGLDIDLREGEAIELRGRNGAGKTTLIKAILAQSGNAQASDVVTLDGSIELDTKVRIGVYEQEVSPKYFDLPLQDAIETMYLDRGLSVTTTKIRSLLSNYLFDENDGKTPLSRLSGGQKARFQLITMLANDPQLLILDEPTNHLDLPSIEELETALSKYNGATIYVSHDGYFRNALGGDVVQIGSE